MECLQEAIDLYKSLQYQEVEGIYDLMGHISQRQGDFQQALKYGLLAV